MNEVVTTVEGAISNELSGLTSLLVSRIKYEIKLAWGFEDELKSLEQEVDELSKLLAGVRSKPITNQLMDDWLKKIKNVVYDANDLLDEWSFEVINLQISTSSSSKCCDMDALIMHPISRFCMGLLNLQISTSTSSSSNCCDMDALIMYPISRFCMGHKINNLRKTISSIRDDGTKQGIKPIEVAAGEVYSNNVRLREIENQAKRLQDKRQYATDRILIGREEDKKKLLQMLRDPIHTNTDLAVIGIVGLAGSGKTALCRGISKEENVLKHFNSLVIWLTVSHNFDLIDSLKKMVEILFKKNPNLTSRDALINKLQEKMRGKKYLLILDDVWDATNFWETFRNTLHEIGGSKGSLILVTTRDKKVVKDMEGTSIKTFIHQLEKLNVDDSWLLFKEIFNDDDLAYHKQKHEIAKRLVGNCRGIPLAIRALGDLLRGEKDIEDWKNIEGSEEWKNEHGILPSLRLSYDYLPNEALKKCFAFCAIFKEDEVIYKDKLIYMWMAHGLLQSKSDRMMEQIGEDYCNVLLNSSLFQEAEMDIYENVLRFKMHDLVKSLAEVISKRECLHSSNGEYDGSTEVVVQHLSLPHFKRELTESCCMKLQTLVHEEKLDVRAVRQLKVCKRLRVLRIGGFLNEDSMLEFLNSSFKHLRFLEVDYNEIQNISSGGFEMMRKLQNNKLYHLQTLWIRYNFGGDSLAFIKVLLMSDLVNLRHIHCGGSIGIPEVLGRVTTLQTISSIDLKKEWGGRISELGSLKNLRGTLTLDNVSHLSSEEDASSLFSAGDNCHIENLRLDWGVSDVSRVQQERVFEAMQPHSNLKRLDIRKYCGTAFPRWLTETASPLCNLVSLILSFCINAEGYLQMENFSCLRLLVIYCCKEVRLSFPDHGFHCCKLLEELRIWKSTKVCQLPDLSPLTKLRVLYHYHSSEAAEDHELVGLGNLACLTELQTDTLLPADLDEHSPLCNSLQKLRLWCPPSGFHAEQLPMQLQHLKTLQCLKMVEYNVETLPEWLGNLTALRQLEFESLRNLKWLPSQQAMQHLSNLHFFTIKGCPILEEDISSKTGEWLKIAHIPYTRIFEQHISPASSHYDSDTNDASSHYDSDTNSDTNDDTNDASPHYGSDTNSDTNDDCEASF